MFRIKKVFTPLMAQTIIKRTMHDRKLPFIKNNNMKKSSNTKKTIIGEKSEIKEDLIKIFPEHPANYWNHNTSHSKNIDENDLLHLLPRNK